MSFIDRIIASVTPPESDEARVQARAKAESYAAEVPWLASVLDHHRQIDAAFAAVWQASDAAHRRSALKELGTILTGHSIAEEVAIYPALSDAGETGHATMAYTEQSAAKMQMGLLERMDPMSQDFEDKFGHLEGAVKHHVYEEEGTWFPELIDQAEQADHAMIEQRYTEEFSRYIGNDSYTGAASSGQSQSQMFTQRDAMSSTMDQTPMHDLDAGRAAPNQDRMSRGSATDDTAGGDDMMSPGKSTVGLPQFRN